MEWEGIFTMSQKELKRLHVMKKVMEKGIKQVEAAEVLGISERQIRRIAERMRREGERGVIHGSRGKPSHNRIGQEKKNRILKIYESRYEGFGPTLAREKLAKEARIGISRETLRKWLIQSGYWQAKRARRRHRQWRERRQYCGEMVQMDGSHHEWLERRGPQLVLMGYIDDATNRIYGRFYEYEGTIPAMDSFKRYIRRYGIPMSVYLDKHTTYKSPGKATIEQELAGEKPLSEFERALGELGVEVIHADSPQAKGRIERLFKTLQDRLVKELRLCGARNLKQANDCLEKYLPEFNQRFSRRVSPREDLHRRNPSGMNMDAVLSIQTRHVLRNDFTLVHEKKKYQILEGASAREVMVQERVDGKMLILAGAKRLKYKPIGLREKPGDQENGIVYLRHSYPPAANHPWKQFPIKTGHPNFAENRTF